MKLFRQTAPMLALVALTGLALTLPTAEANAQQFGYTYKTLDAPDPTTHGTISTRINAHGQIFGYTTNATGTHGMTINKGVYTLFDFPGAVNTGVWDGNNEGALFGNYTDGSGVHHGFVYSNGMKITIDAPDSLGTYVNGVNGPGLVTGGYTDFNGRQHGFLLKNGWVFTILDYPGADNTTLFSINDRGQGVGTYDDWSGTHGFVWYKGVFTPLNAPGAYRTVALDINYNGDVAGNYDDGAGEHGFVLRQGVFYTLDAPGTSVGHTAAYGIADNGNVVGIFGDFEGFLATPKKK